MITCELTGGLGNQMFQIAATYALAKRNNDEAYFNFETCHTPLQGSPSYKYRNNIFKNIKEKLNFIPKHYFKEEKFSFTELPYADNLSLIGYFQSEKYFMDYKEEIKKLFNISFEDIIKIKDFIIILPSFVRLNNNKIINNLIQNIKS
jgi:sporulation protein YlmC with PRC-barrel domain